MDNLLYQIANKYVNFEIEGKRVSIPYAIAEYAIAKYGTGYETDTTTTKKNENYGGKGTPEQIKESLIASAEENHFNLKKATAQEINIFMQKQGVGIDCSGFVYNILNEYLKKTKKKSLDSIILRFSGILGRIERFIRQKNRVRRCDAVTLCSDLNSITIDKVKDMRIADMILLTHKAWKGRHIALIVHIDKQYITYAMTSSYTRIKGSHFAKIKILNTDKGLEKQQWLEVTKLGENYSESFNPSRGDSVRRLKCL